MFDNVVDNGVVDSDLEGFYSELPEVLHGAGVATDGDDDFDPRREEFREPKPNIGLLCGVGGIDEMVCSLKDEDDPVV